MHYKRLQKYGKKLAVAVLTSAVFLASGATVYAEDTGEYMAQENIQETEVTESTVDAETSAESADKEDLKPDQEEEKEEAAEVETQEEGKTQDVSEEQPESEVQIKEENSRHRKVQQLLNRMRKHSSPLYSLRKLRLRFRRRRWKHHIRDGIRVADKPTIWMKT